MQLFQVFDKNGNGRISMAELSEMLTNLGKNVPTKVASVNTLFSIVITINMASSFHVQRELEDVLEELDVDQSGGIDFPEFLQFMIK